MKKQLTGSQALERAQGFYGVIPKAMFDRSTFMELGEAAEVGRPFRGLSQQLKATLFRLVAAYEAELASIVKEESIALAAAEAEQLKTIEAYDNAEEIVQAAENSVYATEDAVANELENTDRAIRESDRTVAVEKIAAENLQEDLTPLQATVTVQTTTTST